MRAVLLAAALLLTAAVAPGPLTIGGHTYAFPPAAFEGGSPVGGSRGEVLLELAWPELRPLTPAEAAAWPRRDTIRILAVSPAPGSDVSTGIQKAAAIAADLPGSIHAEASGQYPAPIPDATPVAAGDVVPGSGTVRVRTRRFAGDEIQRDVFVSEPLARTDRVISCSRLAGPVVNPECAQQFVAAGLFFKVSYRRALVPHWQEIEAGTKAFFKGHETGS